MSRVARQWVPGAIGLSSLAVLGYAHKGICGLMRVEIHMPRFIAAERGFSCSTAGLFVR